jgi:importin subunit beta-1
MLQLMSTEGQGADLRMNAALFVKNLFAKVDPAQQAEATQRWLALDANFKAQAKAACLQVMLSPVKEARQGAAALTARIAVLEFTAAQWLEVIDLLKARATELLDNGQRATALETLGWICEDVVSYPALDDAPGPKEVMASHANSILTAVVFGMRPEEPDANVRYTATAALYNTLEFAERSFENEEERNYIMNVIFAATDASNVNMRAKAFSCLVSVADLYYDHLPAYIEQIFARTKNALENAQERDEVKMQAIEFWSTLADCESEIQELITEAQELGQQPGEQLFDIVKLAFEHLGPIVLTLLVIEEGADPDDVESGEFTVAMASAQCLKSIAICAGDAVVPLVQAFTVRNIGSADWRLREAAVMAYASIMDGPEDALASQLPHALPQFLNLMVSDSSLHVRDTAAWALGTAFHLHTHVLVTDLNTLLADTLQALLHVLTSRASPSICSHACWIIDSIAYYLANSDEAPSVDVLTSTYPMLVEQLIATSQRDDGGDDVPLRVTAIESLNSLIAAAPDSMLQALLDIVVFFVNELNKVTAVVAPDAASRQTQYDMQAGYCSALGALCTKLEQNLTDECAVAIMNACISVFEHGVDGEVVVEEALRTVGAVANAREVEFAGFMQRFAPFLFAALAKIDAATVVTTAVGVVCDCCRALGTEFVPYMRDANDGFMKALRSQESKTLTLSVLGAFGDLAMACGTAYFPLADNLMHVLNLASETKVVLTTPEAVEYYHGLLEAIVDACVGLVNCLDAAESASELPPNLDKYIEFMLRFVLHVTDLKPEVPTTCFASAVGLGYDVGRVLGRFNPTVLQYMSTVQPLVDLFQRSLSASDKSTKDSASLALQLIGRR